MATLDNPAWQTPHLTALKVSLDTANGEGSGGDLEGFSTIPG